ncbi:hypothetical protein [Pseudomonas rossensis]|uniref:hypothetical protein n=1 Tax=Pseudomonas rossensis TaxID=2305471 RepID=UPI003CD0DB65
MLSHRVAVGISSGLEPEAVCHSCDNPSCCNPSHLIAGSRLLNNQDMTAKGRHWSVACPEKSVKGEAHGSAKLSESSVAEIRRLYAQGGVSQREVARTYSVSQRTIAKVINRIGWPHVKDDG